MERLASIIKNNISNPKIYFVFSTDIVRQSWIDWAVRFTEESGVIAVDTDRFVAWDKFKSNYVCTKEEGKIAIPPAMRKVFAQQIIRQNLNAPESEPIFSRIIPTDKEFRKNSFAFTDWIAKILPSLKLWNKQYTENYLKNHPEDDDKENKDYQKLYESYLAFLEENQFYEPSFLDSDFNNKGKKFIIFYPEILEDFAEFQELLETKEEVLLIHQDTKDIEEKKECIVYDNARKELRRLALKLRELQYTKDGDKDFDLRKVAVNVPDLDTIRPYLERELKLYGIPYVMRNSIPVTLNSGGDIFQRIMDCINDNFSYSSVRALLQDGFLPWENVALNESLIRTGCKNRCVCSYEENGTEKDIWLESLTSNYDHREREYYKSLNASIMKFKKADTFDKLAKAWVDFRDEFLKKEVFDTITESDSPELKEEKERYSLTNKILGRMLTELNALCSLENDFMKEKGYCINNVLSFFVNEMNNYKYTPNIKEYGVNIFPYRVSAAANYEYQFIINATQKDITVPFRKLTFITNPEKRLAFGLKEDEKQENIFANKDVSAAFINLYAMSYRENVDKKIFITSSKKNFNGAAITHSCLEEYDTTDTKHGKTDKLTELDKLDFINNYKTAFLNGNLENIAEFSNFQKDAFIEWKEAFSDAEESSPSSNFRKKIYASVHIPESASPKFSESSMNQFFYCPRKWTMQKLNIEEDDLNTNITKNYEIGSLYHKIIELVMLYFRANNNRKVPSYVETENVWKFCDAENGINLTKDFYDSHIIKIIGDEFENALNASSLTDTHISRTVIMSQKEIFVQDILAFLKNFCNSQSTSKNLSSFGGWNIVGLEEEREFDTGKDYILHGVIDCILSNGDAEAIIDYKSGTVPNAKDAIVSEEGILSNFQIAMYVVLLENADSKKSDKNIYDIQDALFYKIRGGMETRNIIKSNNKDGRDNFDPTVSTLLEYATYLSECIKNFDIVPKSKPRNDAEKKYVVSKYERCTECAYKTICRTSYNIAKRDFL